MNAKQNLKSRLKRHISNLLILWFIAGLAYIIWLPFVEIYKLVPAHYLILTEVVGFIISLTLAILLASYLLRHFRIIYYSKGRRFE